MGGLNCEERDLTINEIFTFADIYNEVNDLCEQLEPLEQRFEQLKRDFSSFDIKAE